MLQGALWAQNSSHLNTRLLGAPSVVPHDSPIGIKFSGFQCVWSKHFQKPKGSPLRSVQVQTLRSSQKCTIYPQNCKEIWGTSSLVFATIFKTNEDKWKHLLYYQTELTVSLTWALINYITLGKSPHLLDLGSLTCKMHTLVMLACVHRTKLENIKKAIENCLLYIIPTQ